MVITTFTRQVISSLIAYFTHLKVVSRYRKPCVKSYNMFNLRQKHQQLLLIKTPFTPYNLIWCANEQIENICIDVIGAPKAQKSSSSSSYK